MLLALGSLFKKPGYKETSVGVFARMAPWPVTGLIGSLSYLPECLYCLLALLVTLRAQDGWLGL